ncbi:MAG TPA: hypothetical protein VGI66_07800 [Streptosporangiaceae bacterium]
MTSVNEAELATRTFELPDMFADRVSERALGALRSMARGGEWDELLDLLVAALRQAGAAISAGERDQLRDVLAGWGLPTDQLDELAVWP